MNLEVTNNNLYLFLPGKIARMIQIYARQQGISIKEALLRFSRSDTYRRLTDQSTQRWHYGPVALYEEFMEEEKNVNKNNHL